MTKQLMTSIPATMSLLRSISNGVYKSTTVIMPIYQYFGDNGKTVYSVHKPYGIACTEYDFSYPDGVTYISEIADNGSVDNRFHAWYE